MLWPDDETVALASFASVSVQQEPLWSQAGGWNSPATSVTQNVAFGVVVPYEDVYVAAGGSRASVSVAVYLKTHMGGTSTAAQQVAVGQFKLVFDANACSVSGDSGRNSAFATWESVDGLDFDSKYEIFVETLSNLPGGAEIVFGLPDGSSDSSLLCVQKV